MKKTLLAIIISLLMTSMCYCQEQQTGFTDQDKRGVAFAEADAIKAIEIGDIYIISGGEGNEPIVGKEDLGIIQGLSMKSIGCMGDFEYAKRFNKVIIQYLKQKAKGDSFIEKGFEYYKDGKHYYKPKEGFVPNEASAIKIAEAVWLPIYGEDIYDEKPFNASLKDGIWYVSGSLPEGWLGGVAVVEISKEDGRILRVSHGK